MVSNTPSPQAGRFKNARPQEFRRLAVSCLQDVQAEEVDWLWYPYIPAGKVTLLEGDPGLGKSWITCALAAALSKGEALPGQGALPPQRVLMLSAEDGLGDTVRPRIEKLGGNLQNIFVSDDYFILDPAGLRSMEALMQEMAATIVFIDPIVAYMGGKVDMFRPNEVREVMAALAQAAKRTASSVVAVRHLRKQPSGAPKGKAIYSGIGSIDFVAAVRSVMQVGETDDGGTFMFHPKHNLSEEGPARRYSIVDGRFEWGAEVAKGALLQPKATPTLSTTPSALFQAREWIRKRLSDGPVPAQVVITEACEAGHSIRTLNTAKKGFAHSYKDGQQWYWELGQGDDANDSALLAQVQAVLAKRGLAPSTAEE